MKTKKLVNRKTIWFILITMFISTPNLHCRFVEILSYKAFLKHPRIQRTHIHTPHHTHTHTHLQHGEPSTCACAPSVCKRLDASAAPPHMGQNLSEQPGGGQFCLQCPAHPDSPMSHKATAVPHGDHNTPVTAECIIAVESNACKYAVFKLKSHIFFQCIHCNHVPLTAKCKGLTGILLSTSSRQLNEISRSCKFERRKKTKKNTSIGSSLQWINKKKKIKT